MIESDKLEEQNKNLLEEYNPNEDITVEDSIKVLESLVESRKKYNTLYYNIEIKALEAGIKALKDKVSE